MSDTTLIDINLTLTWESPFAKHTEILYLHGVNPIKDKFPLDFATEVDELAINGSCTRTFQAKDLIGEDFSAEKIFHIERALFNTNFKGKFSPPRLYRFYPKAIANEALETTKQDYSPFKLISINEDELALDCNHPLSKYYLTLTIEKIREYQPKNLTNNHNKFKDIGKLITSNGPGMQVPFEFGESSLFDDYPFKKIVKKDTSIHLDENAIEKIKKLYSEHIPEYGKVLDLLANEKTYLSDDLDTELVVGIGKHEGILASNQRLDTYNTQDLNEETILPYDANYFDVVICTLTIEYLEDPLEFMFEISRVLKKGGKFIITFSNTPAIKEGIDHWDELHSFERMQLVLEFFRNSQLFQAINTYSNRGALRSKKDPYYPAKRISDPIFAVWGEVK